jgi:hypothetical protein
MAILLDDTTEEQCFLMLFCGQNDNAKNIHKEVFRV